MFGEYQVVRVYDTQLEADAFCAVLRDGGLRAKTRREHGVPGIQLLVDAKEIDRAESLLEDRGEPIQDPDGDDFSEALKAPMPEMESLAPDPLSTGNGERAILVDEAPLPADEVPYGLPRHPKGDLWTLLEQTEDGQEADFVLAVLREHNIETHTEGAPTPGSPPGVSMAAHGVDTGPVEIYVGRRDEPHARRLISQVESEDPMPAEKWVAACGVSRQGLADFYVSELRKLGIATEIAKDEGGSFLLNVAEDDVAEARKAIEEAGETWIFDDAGDGVEGAEDPAAGQISPDGRAADPAGEPVPAEGPRGKVAPIPVEYIEGTSYGPRRGTLMEGFPEGHPARTGLPPLAPKRLRPLLTCPNCGSSRVTGSTSETNKLRMILVIVIALALMIAMTPAVGIFSWLVIGVIAWLILVRINDTHGHRHFCRECKHFW